MKVIQFFSDIECRKAVLIVVAILKDQFFSKDIILNLADCMKNVREQQVKSLMSCIHETFARVLISLFLRTLVTYSPKDSQTPPKIWKCQG